MVRRGKALAEQDYAVVFPYGPIGGSFAYSMWMRGFQTFFADLVLRPKIADAIMQRVTELLVKTIQEYIRPLREYIDIAFFGDDLGTQVGPMISPQTYRKRVKPLHKKIVEAFKNATGAKVILHTDGTVSPFIEDISEIGVAGINPVQVSARDMNTRELKARFGERIAFWGAIDTQNALPFGTEEEVRSEVRHRIDDLGRGGGYVLTSVHNMIPPTPARNVIAMFDEAARYGGAFYSRGPGA
jgi:uroporphyrinogen decarboxylase